MLSIQQLSKWKININKNIYSFFENFIYEKERINQDHAEYLQKYFAEAFIKMNCNLDIWNKFKNNIKNTSMNLQTINCKGLYVGTEWSPFKTQKDYFKFIKGKYMQEIIDAFSIFLDNIQTCIDEQLYEYEVEIAIFIENFISNFLP
jgi:hypothetical protein